MKFPDYRITVLFIMVFVAVSVGVKLFAFQPEPSPAVITVNSTAISQDRFDHFMTSRSSRQSRDELIQSVIIKELLIQEALKADIQTEAPFRQSVRDFYEQSLIKTMMDRTYAALVPRVDEDMVERYQHLIGQTVSLTLMTYKKPEDLANRHFDTEERLTVPFNRLSTQVRYDLLSLSPGDYCEPAFSETDKIFSVFRLEHIIAPSSETKSKENRTNIRKLLEEQQKEQLISSWLNDLKENAVVSVNTNSKTL